MPKLDIKDFETKVVVRGLRADDFPKLIEMQIKCFSGMQHWALEQIESQLQHFPDGQIVIEIDGEIVASSSCLIVDFEDHDDWHDWKSISDSGYIRNHDPEGDTMYGIEIMVDPEYRGLRLARRLYNERKRICRECNLRRIIVGGRIPGYGAHADEMSAREYVENVMSRNFYDPVLTAQLSNGFQLKRLIADYFPSDSASRGYATFLEWTNLDHVEEGVRKYRAVSQARLCLVQYHMRRVTSFDEFAMQAQFFTDLAADYKSDFVLFPELFTTQLLSLIEADRPSDAARKLAEFTPRYLELFNEFAVKYHINIIGGSQFMVEEGKLFNVAYLFRRNGSIERQFKIHVTPNEAKWWGVSPGNKVEVFDTDRGRIAILICYDVEFPELARIAAAKGAQILFVPYNTDERYGFLRVRHCAQARAIENQYYVAIAGCAGMLPFVDNADMHYAQAGLFTPSDFPFARDAVASESMPNIETVVIHDVDLELTRRNRLTGTVRPWSDRRRDLYSVRYTGDGETLDV